MDHNTFDYTYSAQEHEELLAIKKRYETAVPAEKTAREATMEELRQLDRAAARPGKILTVVMLVVGILVFGTGMSFVTEFSDTLFIPGVVIGVVGMAVTGLTFPLCNAVNKKQKEKIAPKILALTEELLK